MTNNDFNSNDFSNGCEGLENGSEQTFDKMAESVDKANVERIGSKRLHLTYRGYRHRAQYRR